MSSQPEPGSVSEDGVPGHGAVESVTSPLNNKSNEGVDVQGGALALDDPGVVGASGDSWLRVTERQRGGGGGGEEAAAAFPRAKPKKTRGRVKIDIDFIEDRFRRRTTFSKRKKYIIKKAQELATLTGTQVLVLAHSETGRIHDWSTPLFQPIINSKDGKALIKTCLEKGRPADPSESPPTAGSKEPDIAFQLSETEDLGPMSEETEDLGPSEDAPRHSEDAPRHSEDAPRHSEDAPRHSEDAPRHSEDAPRHSEDAPRHSEDAHLQPQNAMPPSTPYLDPPVISRRQLQMAWAGQPTFYW